MRKQEREMVQNLVILAVDLGLNFTYYADVNGINLTKKGQSTSTFFLNYYQTSTDLANRFDKIILEANNL
jgi:hypothetical protein